MQRIYWLTAGAIVIAVIAVAAVYLGLPTPTPADSRVMILPFDPQQLVIETDQGERSFTIEIADSEDERQRGLMFRQDMDDGHGMLFVFEEQRELGFWMKDTPMPLDLIFIGQDGAIKAIKQGEPHSEAVVASGQPARFVLELKAGIAARNDVERGDKVRHRAINQAAGAASPVDQ